MAVTYTIQGRLDGLNDYTRSCRTNAYKVLTARKRIKESVNTAYRYGYAKRN